MLFPLLAIDLCIVNANGDFLLNRLTGNSIKQSKEEYQLALHGLVSFHHTGGENIFDFCCWSPTFLILFLFQFGDLGSLEQHGFARNRMWSLDRDPSPLPPLDNQSSVDLILKSTKVDLKTPHRYIYMDSINLCLCS